MLGRVISIDMLPDEVLLEIFDFYVGVDPLKQKGLPVEVCRTLVHVCRRWRSLVFGSPHRLKLRLVCTNRTPTMKALDVWPALPLIITGHASTFVMDHLIAVLERRDRVCKINLCYHDNYDSPESEKLWAAMQAPFPELRHLCLEARSKPRPRIPEEAEDWEWVQRPVPQVVSDSFLGGSAPRLQYIWMNAVKLRGLEKLLLSTTHLVDLHLIDIPEYIPYQPMATCLSLLTSLQTLNLAYQYSLYDPYQENRHPSPPTHAVLPTLRCFKFKGASKYLENLMALIDAPELNKLSITFDQRVFDTPELAKFVGRVPKLGVPCEARMVFHHFRIAIGVRLPSQISGHGLLDVGISSGDVLYTPIEELDPQLSCLARVCASLLPTVSTVENLYIYEDSSSALSWSEDTESTQWVKLLRPFIALKNLYLSRKIAPRIASALEEAAGEDYDAEEEDDNEYADDYSDNGEGGNLDDLGGGGTGDPSGGDALVEDLNEGNIRVTELLPSLQNIFVQGHHPSGCIQEGIREFIAAQRLIGHPIAVFAWDIKFDETW